MYYVYGYLCVCMCVSLLGGYRCLYEGHVSVQAHLQRELGLHCLGGLRQFIQHRRGLSLSNRLMGDLSGILGSPG